MAKIKFTFSKRDPGFHEIGELGSDCPYCSAVISPRPQRKKRCPHCGNPVYVRTRPIDKKKVLLAEDELLMLAKEWRIYHEVFEDHQVDEEDFLAEKARLIKGRDIEPSNRVVLWSLYNRRLLEYGRNHYWGLYVNTLLDMAELERKQGYPEHALRFYFLISYFDANGPNNIGPGLSNQRILSVPAFDPASGTQAPGIISRIKSLIKELDLTCEESMEVFLQTIKSAMQLPKSGDEVWGEIWPLIYEGE
jgi:hypothetical protein